jgi:hypothetical protein
LKRCAIHLRRVTSQGEHEFVLVRPTIAPGGDRLVTFHDAGVGDRFPAAERF